ncbi:hypothetical protein GH714_005770 [Hevea brasiliensis]|uniref:Reverse transcriptase domain-containing protein n=1 Tax=Hevea brasiliensis TaxID=3981 RepID=A0A6A6LCB3_HEVBR|nr:hypothetical protein GH714_005770 [Hevea brasiliensis]
MLQAPFSLNEIKLAIWLCDSTKGPGSDNANFNCYKKAWLLIKDDLLHLFNEFHATITLPSSIHSSFIAHILKLSRASRVQDYHLISLIHGVYKIVAKVLALGLKLVLPKIISHHQSAFASGRQILNYFLIASKILEYQKKKKRGWFLFKIDFEKAFDSVLWRHLDYTMVGMGFGAKWRSWILHCVTNAKVSILLVGRPMEEFQLGNGIRQGDPLSPFIFIMAVEPLCLLIQTVCTSGKLEGVSIRDGNVVITHQKFADYALFFTPPNLDYVIEISRILSCFEVMSGISVNFHKSLLYGINVNDSYI